MRHPVVVSQLHLYIINSIRRIRLELGLSQRDISRLINSDADNNLLGSIESNFRNEKYTDENLNKLAKAFSNIDPNKDYTVYDFYPTSALPEALVEKSVIDIPKSLGPTASLTLLLEKEHSFFNDWHNAKEITIFCNESMVQKWKPTDFTSVIARAVESGKLIRSSEIDPKYKIA